MPFGQGLEGRRLTEAWLSCGPSGALLIQACTALILISTLHHQAITAFIKSALQQCLSIQLTFRLAIMWHVERVWWLGAIISCFWRGLLCILTSMNKEGHSRNGYRLFCSCLWGAKALTIAIACHQSVARLTSAPLILRSFNSSKFAAGCEDGYSLIAVDGKIL